MQTKRLRIIVAIILLTFGLYAIFLTTIAPNHEIKNEKSQNEYVRLIPISKNNTLIIPKISVRAEIKEGGVESLKDGKIWHRQPKNGNPEKGGNFVLAGHRYQIALTPDHTIRNSVLYDLDKLKIDDRIIVDWQSKRYTYKVTKTYSVQPNALEIENTSSKPKLTLYTCTLAGSVDGRIVVEATNI